MPRALIALGSNLGDRERHLLAALAAVASEPGIELDDVAPFEEFAAVRVADADPGGPYLNTVATIVTTLSAPNLLHVLKAMERRLGRDASMAHGSPRTIDLDLILYDLDVIATRTLRVPHPGLASRLFVLRPAAQIAGDWPVPGTGTTIAGLLARRSARQESSP